MRLYINEAILAWASPFPATVLGGHLKKINKLKKYWCRLECSPALLHIHSCISTAGSVRAGRMPAYRWELLKATLPPQKTAYRTVYLLEPYRWSLIHASNWHLLQKVLFHTGGAFVWHNPEYPLIILNNAYGRDISPVLTCILFFLNM